MSDEPDRQDLEDRVEQLESTISKMLPGRRDALKLGGAALVGGAAMSGTASAGTQQAGTIGTENDPVDVESEDINNADTVTTQDLVVNGTATGPFGGGGIVFEDGDSIQQFRGQVNITGPAFFDVFNLSSGVDVYGGAVYGAFAETLRITFASDNVVTLGGAQAIGASTSVQGIFPMKSVKRLEVENTSPNNRKYGFMVYTT